MKAVLNFRYWVLAVLGITSIVALFSSPNEELPIFTWFFMLIASKVFGIAIFILFCAILEKWDEEGKVPELTGLMRER